MAPCSFACSCSCSAGLLLQQQQQFNLAETVSPQLWGKDQVDAFRLLHADAPDLRGALLWATGSDGSTDLALRLVGQLWHYWELTEDVAEPCQIARKLVARTPKAMPALTAPALSGTATLCWLLGRNEEAAELHRQALQAFKSADNDEGAAWTTMCLAVQAMELNDADAAHRMAAEALNLPHASARTRAAAMTVMERLAFYAGDHVRAHRLSSETVNLARQLGDRFLLAQTSVNLAESVEQAGDYGSAERLLLEAIKLGLELGAKGNLVGFLESLAGVNVEQHRVEQAIRVLAATDAYRTDRGLPLYPAEQQHIESIITNARTEAGPIRFGLAWAGGQALTLTQVIHEVLHTKQVSSQQEPVTDPRAPGLPAWALSAAPWS